VTAAEQHRVEGVVPVLGTGGRLLPTLSPPGGWATLLADTV
jgi:hypothetical protein